MQKHRNEMHEKQRRDRQGMGSQAKHMLLFTHGLQKIEYVRMNFKQELKCDFQIPSNKRQYIGTEK